MATIHIATVESVDELPEPIENTRALVLVEYAVYVSKKVKGDLKWVFETKLKAE